MISRKRKAVLQVGLLGLLFLCANAANAVTYSNAPTTFSWVDPAAHTAVVWSNPTQGTGGCDTGGDDSVTALINIGFTFNFGGVNYTQLRIMSNGRVQFNNTYCYAGSANSSATARTYTLPYPNANIVRTMKVYGADIDTTVNGSGGGPGPTACPPATCSVRYTVTPLGTAPNRQFVVTWVNTPDWGSTSSFYNFQVILNEDGSFIYQYGASNNPDNGKPDIGWEVTTTDYGLYTYANIGALANTAVRFFIPNAVAEYRMEEAIWSGANSVVDSSGNNNNGSPVGGAQTVAGGYICRGASIPNNTSTVTIDAINAGLDVDTAIGSRGTITFWYQLAEAWGANDRQLFDATTVNNRWFFLTKRSNRQLRFVLTDSANANIVLTYNATNYAANTWVHIAVTWNLTTNRYYLYVNGAQVANSTTASSGSLNSSINTLYLGDNRSLVTGQSGTGNSANGVLDEVRIYNYDGGIGLIQRDYNNTRSCVPPIDNFLIDVGAAAASTCSPKNITITARDASNLTLTTYTGTVNLATSAAHGDWAVVTANGTLTNGVADDGASTYTFAAADNGVITLSLSDTHADDTTVSVVDNAVPATLSTSATINFRDNTFVITNDPIQVAGRDQAMTAALWQRDLTTGNCSIATGYTGAKNLDAWLTRDVSDPGGAAPTIGAVSLPSAAPPINPASNNLALTFTAGSAGFNLSTTDVGKYVLNLRDDTRLYATGVDIVGASNAMTTRPWLHVAVSGNPGASAATGMVFTSAGTDFTATVRGVLWQAGDDGNNDGAPDIGANLADNGVTPGYAWDTVLSPTTPFTPATPSDAPPGTGTAGVLNNGTIAQAAFSGGAATVASLQYTEVGSFTMLATANNYLNSAGVDLSAANGVVGRFTPAYFNVTKIDGCSGGATFTYSGQPFTVIVIAKNALDATTTNYAGVLGFAKDATVSNAGDASNFTNNALAAANFVSGVRNQINVTYTFPTPPGKDVVPLTLTLRAVEDAPAGDGVTSATGGTEETAEIRSGRVRIVNAYGSELVSMAVPMRVEYYSSDGWVTNTVDTCTSVIDTSLSLSNATAPTPVSPPILKKLNATVATTGASIANSPFLLGDAGLSFSAPGAGGDGYVDVTSDLSAKTWLRYDWDNDLTEDDPTGRATFGLFRGSPKHIYQRERY
ncbi:MAG: LamG domain-containing protein [Sulfuricaulis sp.]|uniref:LamG domain-containing protein n=1 Tax=Sulfuricaulis sp. TaxID=2003553 RepID=UPI0025F30BDC|nr:LamG domain-containing protein [Sulfuricaulis sp.]MCR4346837.1 LamG domain-containing protein [Sulfuricaulis sp.]